MPRNIYFHELSLRKSKDLSRTSKTVDKPMATGIRVLRTWTHVLHQSTSLIRISAHASPVSFVSALRITTRNFSKSNLVQVKNNNRTVFVPKIKNVKTLGASGASTLFEKGSKSFISLRHRASLTDKASLYDKTFLNDKSSLAKISYAYNSILNKKYKEVLRMLWLCLLITALILENNKLRGDNKLRSKYVLQEIWSRLNIILSNKIKEDKDIPLPLKNLYFLVRTKVIMALTKRLRGTSNRIRNRKLFSFGYKKTRLLRKIIFVRKQKWNDQTWFHYWTNNFKTYLGIGKYNPDLSDRLLFSYVKERKLEIKSKLSFHGIFHKHQELHYSFKKSLNKIHLKSLYDILKSFFKGLNCIISKPLLKVSPDTIKILLFFYEKPSLAKALSQKKYKKYLLRKGKLLRHAQFQYKLNKLERRAFMINFIDLWKEESSTFKLSMVNKAVMYPAMLKNMCLDLTTLGQVQNKPHKHENMMKLQPENILTRNAFNLLEVLKLYMEVLENIQSKITVQNNHVKRKNILSFHKYLNNILLSPNIKKIDKYLSYLCKDLRLSKKYDKSSVMVTKSWPRLLEVDLHKKIPVVQDLSIWPSHMSNITHKAMTKAYISNQSHKDLTMKNIMENTSLDSVLLKDFEEYYFIYIKYLNEINFLVKSYTEVLDLNKTWLDFINLPVMKQSYLPFTADMSIASPENSMNKIKSKLNFTWTYGIYLFTIDYLKKLILYLSTFKKLRLDLATQKKKYEKNPELFFLDKELYLDKLTHLETRTQILKFLRMNYKDYDYLTLTNLENVFLSADANAPAAPTLLNTTLHKDYENTLRSFRIICSDDSKSSGMTNQNRDMAQVVLELLKLNVKPTMNILNSRKLLFLINEQEIEFRNISPFVKFSDLHKFKYTIFLIMNALHILYRSTLCLSLSQNNIPLEKDICNGTDANYITDKQIPAKLLWLKKQLDLENITQTETQTKLKLSPEKVRKLYSLITKESLKKLFSNNRELSMAKHERDVTSRNFVSLEALDKISLARNASGTSAASSEQVLPSKHLFKDQNLSMSLGLHDLSQPSLEYLRNEKVKLHNKKITSVLASNILTCPNMKDNTLKSFDLITKYQDINKLSLHAHKLFMLRHTLEKIFHKKIKLDLIRLKYPYHESNILTQVLAFSSNNLNFFRITKLLHNFAVLTQSKNLFRKDLFKVIPSYLSGIKVKLGGRLLTESTRPRKTRKTFQIGCLSRSKVSFTSHASLTRKNKKGAYTFTVTTGHILPKK